MRAHISTTFRRLFRGGTLAAATLVLFANDVHAQAAGSQNAKAVAGRSGLPGANGGSLTGVIGGMINAVLGLVGVVFFVLLIYAGFMWMTAAGNEDKIKKAKTILVSSIIGLAIILAAYTITTFVVGSVINGTTATS